MTIWKVIFKLEKEWALKHSPEAPHNLHILYLICMHKLSQTVYDLINSLRKGFVDYL